MKKIISLVVLATVVLASCTTNNNDDYQAINRLDFKVNELHNSGKNTKVTCAMTDLIAGQHIDVGMIYILADETNLYVTYAANGWEISETHMFIGERSEIPTNSTGNPRIGHFSYRATHAAGTNEVTYSIPLTQVGDCFTVAAHAVVINNDGGSETAWGEGLVIEGANWAMATDYCVKGCTDDDELSGPKRIR